MLKKQVFIDAISLDVNKKATIMRDGYYIYLAREVGLPEEPDKAQVRVYRPKSEVKKAYDRFKELGKLPLVYTHPNDFLNLNDSETYKDGEAFNPSISKIVQTTVLNADLKLRDEVYEEYSKGVRQLSCGWAGYFEKAPQTELNYDYIQRFEDINHIALVEAGRAGDICRILDCKAIEIKDGGLKMPSIEQILSVLKELGVDADKAKVEEAIKKLHAESSESTDDDDDKKDDDKSEEKEATGEKEAVEVKEDGEENKPEEKKEGEKEEVKQDDAEEAEGKLHLEMTKQGLKTFLTAHAGMSEEDAGKAVESYFKSKEDAKKDAADDDDKKDDDKAKVMDSAELVKIVDKAIKDEAIRFSDVYPVIKTGEFSQEELKGKTASEIKKMFILKTMKLSKVNDAAIDDVFELALKTYQHPNWSKINDNKKEDGIANDINNITFKKEDK